MKKLFSVLAVGLLLFAFACGGGGGKYAEAKKIMEETADTMEEFMNSVEKAGSADDVVAAINKFSDSMKKLKPKVEELQKKYPELKNEKEVPEELKPVIERFNSLGSRMMGAMGNIAKYAADPKVQEAQQKLMEAMK